MPATDHTIRDYVGRLRSAADGLLSRPRVSPAGLLNLSRRIAFDLRSGGDLSDVLNVELSPAVPGDGPQRLDPTTRAVFQSGLRVARLLAWVAVRWHLPPVRARRLIVAGLLHDWGWLVLRRTPGQRAASLDTADDDARCNHPLAGAALAAGLTGLHADVPAWIATHHERRDGTGYPRGLRGDAVPTEAQLLAIVVRLLERVPVPASETALPEACRALARDAAAGEFDPALVDALLSLLPVDVPRPAASGGPSRVDAPHEGIAGPHRAAGVPRPSVFTRESHAH